MLVLTRSKGQAIVIGGEIVVRVLSVAGDRVQLGIDAPGDVIIRREELERRVQAGESPDLRIYKPAA